MSILHQMFSRGILGAKCKTCLTLAISRIKLLQNKREMALKLMRKEIAEFLHSGQEAIARIRVEHVIKEQNAWEAYEILELFCEFVLARVPILDNQRECPTELQEAVASIIFSAPRCSELPDLLQVRNLFASKYGKEFVAAASELRPDTSVNRTIVEKLSIGAPSPEVKLKVLREIVHEHNIIWDSTETEKEFSKKPEDLLNGPKQITIPPQSLPRPKTQKDSSSSIQYVTSSNGDHGMKSSSNSRSPFPDPPRVIESSSEYQNLQKATENKQLNGQTSDAMQRARAAIAAAERASAAARSAAELVKASKT